MEIRNARINSTSLGELGRGFSSFINIDYGGSAAQSYGGYSLRGEYAYKWISGILEALEVETWEKLPGTHCRIKEESGRIVAIGNILEDKWYSMK